MGNRSRRGRASLFLALAGLAVAAWAPPARAQDVDTRLVRFDGGVLRGDIRVNAGIITGIGAGNAATAGIATSALPDAAAAYWNPAALARVAGNQVLLDFVPNLSIEAAERFGLDDEIVDGQETALRSIRALGDTLLGSEFNSELFQQGGIRGGAAAVAAGDFLTLGAALAQPIDLALEVVGGGISLGLDLLADVGGQTETIQFASITDFSVVANLRATQLSFAAAAQLEPWAQEDVAVGFSVDRYDASAVLSGRIVPQAVIARGGNEEFYNDETKSWHNDLTQSADGRFAGHGWGFKAAVSYRMRGMGARPILDLVYVNAPSFTLLGDMTIRENRPPFLDDPPTLPDLSELTQTDSLSNPTATEVKVQLPSKLEISLAVPWREATILVDWASYHGVFAAGFLDYAVGIEPETSLRAAFQYHHFFMGGGVIHGKTVEDNLSDTALRDDVTLPLAGIGGTFRVSDSVQLSTLVYGVPMPFLRLTAAVEF